MLLSILVNECTCYFFVIREKVRINEANRGDNPTMPGKRDIKSRRAMWRWHASLFANIGEPRAENLRRDRLSDAFETGRRWLPRERKREERERENCVCRHTKPIQFADNSGLLSGNYFRGLGKRISRLPPSSPKGLARDRSRRAQARGTHDDDVRDRPFEDEIDRRRRRRRRRRSLVPCQK